ncbi:hypothetical protein TIFTF001_033232 [Ficus carica]|uniref:F-box domain-containing protein n=1 Tax=Ficus carica TaxID=3494 RepID=A0AA88DYK7_FICCA|nr:hypothetical protein TIFTF001_033232 [Ficus carica]
MAKRTRHHPIIIMAGKKMKRDNRMEKDREPETVFENRISELPDAIILHILSFLPTLDAVRMSVLSKRWRSMWTLVPVLDFSSLREILSIRNHVGSFDTLGRVGSIKHSYFSVAGSQAYEGRDGLSTVEEGDAQKMLALDCTFFGDVDHGSDSTFFRPPVSINLSQA